MRYGQPASAADERPDIVPGTQRKPSPTTFQLHVAHQTAPGGRVHADLNLIVHADLDLSNVTEADTALVHAQRSCLGPVRAVMVQNTRLQGRTVASAVSSRFARRSVARER